MQIPFDLSKIILIKTKFFDKIKQRKEAALTILDDTVDNLKSEFDIENNLAKVKQVYELVESAGKSTNFSIGDNSDFEVENLVGEMEEKINCHFKTKHLDIIELVGGEPDDCDRESVLLRMHFLEKVNANLFDALNEDNSFKFPQ